MTDLDVDVLVIIKDEVIARLTTTEDFAATYCIAVVGDVPDFIVVSRGDEILWVVDGMTPGWYIPKSTQDVFDRYPELKGKC